MRDFSFPLASFASGCSPMMRGGMTHRAACGFAHRTKQLCRIDYLSGDDVTST